MTKPTTPLTITRQPDARRRALLLALITRQPDEQRRALLALITRPAVSAS